MFLGYFTCCCDRKAWDSCKQSWVRNKNCSFSCSFSSSFNYPGVHHLPWIGSHFPVQTVKRKRKWVVRGELCNFKAPAVRWSACETKPETIINQLKWSFDLLCVTDTPVNQHSHLSETRYLQDPCRSPAWPGCLAKDRATGSFSHLVRVACQSSAWGKTPELGSVPDLICRSMTKCCFACFFLSDVSDGLFFILPLCCSVNALFMKWNASLNNLKPEILRWSPLLYLLVLLFLWEYLGNSRNICVPG